MFETKLKALCQALNIENGLGSWQEITPRQILSVEGIGPATLDQLRHHLAQHGLTLKNDGTPTYWQKNLANLRDGQEPADPARLDVAPFTVLVDSMEQQPFCFHGMQGPFGKPCQVPTKWKALGIRDGRFYQPMGDYSILGCESLIHLERKSVADCQSTVLGFGGRRERFEHELEVLSSLPWSAVIVEGTLAEVVRTVEAHGSKPVEHVRKTLFHTMLAWQQDFRTPWFFCEGRRMAETVAWRTMVRFWQKLREKDRQSRQSKKENGES